MGIIDFSWENIKHFKPEEFDDVSYPGSNSHMSRETIVELELICEITGFEIEIHNTKKIRGAVCVQAIGHSLNSYHYAAHKSGCSAVDWHFKPRLYQPVTREERRKAFMAVLESKFTGIGIYHDWHWGGKLCDPGFHTDMRAIPQVWCDTKAKGRVYILP